MHVSTQMRPGSQLSPRMECSLNLFMLVARVHLVKGLDKVFARKDRIWRIKKKNIYILLFLLLLFPQPYEASYWSSCIHPQLPPFFGLLRTS